MIQRFIARTGALGVAAIVVGAIVLGGLAGAAIDHISLVGLPGSETAQSGDGESQQGEQQVGQHGPDQGQQGEQQVGQHGPQGDHKKKKASGARVVKPHSQPDTSD